MRSARPRSQTVPSRRSTALARLPAAAVAVLALALAGCGDGSEGPETPEAEPLGQEVGGSVAQLAQCRDWNKGTEEEKLATIDDIRSQINLRGSAVDAPPLSDDEAMDVFNNACAESFAKGFRLYILYSRAAAFAPLTR